MLYIDNSMFYNIVSIQANPNRNLDHVYNDTPKHLSVMT